jgi:hypothetical protein
MKKSACSLFLFYSLSFSAFAQVPSGPAGSYHLNNSAIDFSGNNYNGSLSATAATLNRFGASNEATAFIAGSSTGTLPLGLITALQNDFTIAYWFKTSMTASSSSQWYGGNAMVDAEVCGGTTDWGTALIDGGKVCMGIGNPDLTIKSTSSYNDGNWHFVTAVRNKIAGSIILYVDGSQVASTAGTTTSALAAPTFLGLGKNPCGSSAMFTGSLDDIIAYNRVLTSTEISNMYIYLSGIPLSLHWTIFTGEINTGGIKLKWEVEQVVNNDHFEIEHSTDGVNFSSIASIAANAGVMNGSKIDYSFLHTTPANGIHYYRVRQVDADGKFSYSKTISFTLRNSLPAVHLKFNPVHNELELINPGQQTISQLLVMDVSGRLLMQQNINSNNSSIRSGVHDLPAGYYLLQVKKATGELVNTSFIKQ